MSLTLQKPKPLVSLDLSNLTKAVHTPSSILIANKPYAWHFIQTIHLQKLTLLGSLLKPKCVPFVVLPHTQLKTARGIIRKPTISIGKSIIDTNLPTTKDWSQCSPTVIRVPNNKKTGD